MRLATACRLEIIRIGDFTKEDTVEGPWGKDYRGSRGARRFLPFKGAPKFADTDVACKSRFWLRGSGFKASVGLEHAV